MQCKNDSTVLNESDSADKPLHSYIIREYHRDSNFH